MPTPQPLFVSGCPRSGTTALARLLNLHPDIVVGIERFKRLYGQTHQVDPGLFTAERFFDFRPGETGFVPGSGAEADAFYARAQHKFASARFVGDKYPQFFRFYGALFQSFPSARVVFIVRDPLRVAQSWQRRAEDGSSWPSRNDARKSVTYWNDALAYTLAYTRIAGGAFHFVDYDPFFRAGPDALFALFASLGAELTPAQRAQVEADAAPEYARTRDILDREIDLPAEIQEEVRRGADLNFYRRVRKIIAGQP